MNLFINKLADLADIKNKHVYQRENIMGARINQKLGVNTHTTIYRIDKKQGSTI